VESSETLGEWSEGSHSTCNNPDTSEQERYTGP